MKSVLPFTRSTLAAKLKGCELHPDDEGAAYRHAVDVLSLVEQLVAKTTEDGATDPRQVVLFLDGLFLKLTGRSRSTLRTAIPVEEWDRRCDALHHELPGMQSSLSPGALLSGQNERHVTRARTGD